MDPNNYTHIQDNLTRWPLCQRGAPIDWDCKEPFTPRYAASDKATCRDCKAKFAAADLASLPDPDADDFGAQLAAWRRSRNLTQEACSGLIGVPLSTLQKWESGRHLPGRPGRHQTERPRPVYDRLQALRGGIA